MFKWSKSLSKKKSISTPCPFHMDTFIALILAFSTLYFLFKQLKLILTKSLSQFTKWSCENLTDILHNHPFFDYGVIYTCITPDQAFYFDFLRWHPYFSRGKVTASNKAIPQKRDFLPFFWLLWTTFDAINITLS